MYRQRTIGEPRHWNFIALDLISLQIAFILAYCIRHDWTSPYLRESYRVISLLITMIDIVLLLMGGSLKNVMRRSVLREAKSCFKSAAIITLLAVFYLFSIQGSLQYSRLVMYMTGMFYFVLNLAARQGCKALIKRSGGEHGDESMLIAARRENAAEVIRKLNENKYGMSAIKGIILLDAATDEPPESIEGVPVVAGREDMKEYILRNWVDELLVITGGEGVSSGDAELEAQLNQIAASGVAVHRVLDAQRGKAGLEQTVEVIGGYTVLTDTVKIVTPAQAFLKRCMDLFFGLIGALLALIALLIVGPILYVQSPGPIIFKQKRVGRNGKIFTMYKIRSMCMDAEQRKKELSGENLVADGMMFKLQYDPRIIGCRRLEDGTIKKGIGNYIRDWSIDELPQFFNVLKGDMSLVGTRPPTLDEWEKYELQHRARMAFKPGITGLWQVSGRSEITNFNDVVELDMKYISGWSLEMDVKIILQTIKVVLGRRGAM